MFPLRDDGAYARWVAAFDTLSDADRAAMAETSARLPRRPLFSLIIPPGWLTDAAAPLMASLARQIYPGWEVWAERGFPLAAPPWMEDRIFRYDSAPGGVAGGLDAALARLDGDFVVAVPDGVVLADQALFELAVAALENPEAELLYSDEDRIDPSGRRFAPRFKTGWDPELVLARDSIGALAAYRTDALKRAGGFPRDAGLAAPADMALYALALRTVSAGDAARVAHVPAVLCHRAIEPAWDPEAARDLVRAHLARTGQPQARVSPAPLAPHWSRIERPLPSPQPLVSVIVPTRDGAGLLKACAEGLLAWTDYDNIELLIVDNGSEEPATFALFETLLADPRVRILPQPGPFNFSALNNRAAEQARGEVLLLLNNDTEVIEPGWLAEMVSHALRPEVGAVGAKLIYANGRIQHAGVVLGRGTEITHQLRLAERTDPGPDGELALTRTVAAVTGACLAVRRSVFVEAGGLDEVNLAVGFNDIDLCLRIAALGYRNVCTPFACLFHLESVSRGHDEAPEKRERMMRELNWMMATWGPALAHDRHHNTNLTLGWNESGLAAPPRRAPPWRRPLGPAAVGGL